MEIDFCKGRKTVVVCVVVCIHMVVFITTAAAIYSLGNGLCTFTAVLMST